MNQDSSKAPPIPPRIPLPKSFQIKKNSKSQRFCDLDVVPPPPSFKINHGDNRNKKIEDSQILLNLAMHSVSINRNEPKDLQSNQNIFNKNQLNNIPNSLNAFSNECYKTSYFNNQNTIGSKYTSVNNSPIHFPQLTHSISSPSFSSTNKDIDNNSSTRIYNSNFHRNSLNQNNLISANSGDSTNINDILNRIQNHNKITTIKKIINEDLIDLGTENDSLNNENLLTLFDPLSEGYSNRINEKKSFLNKENENEAILLKLKKPKEFTTQNFYESIKYEPSKAVDNCLNSLDNKEINFRDNEKYLKNKPIIANNEIINFTKKLKHLRSKYLSEDSITNLGYVISPRLKSLKDSSMSVKLVIETKLKAQPICFTCNVNTSVEHVVCHAVCSIYDNASIDFTNFILKVYGLNEYLIIDSNLVDYVYVHQCHKFDRDVKLSLISKSEIEIFSHKRTKQDDEYVEDKFSEIDILPNLLLCKYSEIHYENVKILLDIIDVEANKLLNQTCPENSQILLKGVYGSIKALCSMLGFFETIQLTDALNNLTQLYLICEQYKMNSHDPKLNITIDSVHSEIIGNAILTLKKSIYSMLHLYSELFPVNFICVLPSNEINLEETKYVDISQVEDSLICKIDSLSCFNCEWPIKFRQFYFKCELIHGEKLISEVASERVFIQNQMFPRIELSNYIDFDISILNLPRETYLYITLIGIEQSTNNDGSENEKISELGITAIRLFNRDNVLIGGKFLLGLWPDKFVNAIYKPIIRESCLDKNCPLLVVNIIENDYKVKFPSLDTEEQTNDYKQSLSLIDSGDQENIYQILNRDPIDEMTYEDKQTLWERRMYLSDVPSALPKILSSAPAWQASCLPSIYKLIRKWCDLPAIDAIQLLLPCYADKFVREMAVKWIKQLEDDEIYDYLPQLVHALRYETELDSPLTWMLLEKSYSNVRIAHQLYWLLKGNLLDSISGWRAQVLFASLSKTIGNNLKKMMDNEENLLNKLNSISKNLKKGKDNRMKTLLDDLQSVQSFVNENKTSLPLGLSMEVCDLDFKACSYFNSNTLPIKLVFKTEKNDESNCLVEALYKVGDDLRQDTLTMQMINIMDKLWLKEGLDLKIITFSCIATDERKGFIEMVKNSETLRKIQGEQGVTGSFKDKSIANWLQKHNTSELEYKQAVENFTYSCAGYAVATYVLGVGDRHNDNIMLTTSGHLFHIDFGKFLGDSQMIGSIKRDRVPFVLTSDMAYVINRGDKPSMQFQYFIDICCQAYNIIRRNTNLFLSLFSLMLSAQIPGVTAQAIKYVHNALKPTLTDCKASEQFNRLIGEALKSKSTQINFFIHNLAQMRFSGDLDDQKSLSFAPKVFTRQQDGTIEHIKVENITKCGQQNKQYYYVFRIVRQGMNINSGQRLYRTYKEVYELYQKLSSFFRLAKFNCLARPKSNSREFTEKKISEVRAFFDDIMSKANEIQHSDLVYTFFHPLLRDQEATQTLTAQAVLNVFRGSLTNHNTLNREACGANGEIKLSLLYKNSSLVVMIMHAKNLVSTRYSSPDTYVKTYLLPDPFKYSKRKTKICSKNIHPTFLELIVYRNPLEELRKYILEVSVWDHDSIGENLLLGATLINLNDINLTKEIVAWYPLTFEDKRRERK